MEAYSNEEDFRQKKKPVSREVREGIIQGRVKIQREMRRKIVEKSENVIIHSHDVRIMAMLPDLLEVVNNAANNPGKLVTQNGESHASWGS
jgi:DUF917 family protein